VQLWQDRKDDRLSEKLTSTSYPRRMWQSTSQLLSLLLPRRGLKSELPFFYLKNKKYLADQFALNDYPDSMLRRFTSFDFYKDEYKYWLLKYNTEGELVIRAGLRQPESRLGFVTFKEKTRVA